jgi:hypothetical protein
MERTGVGGWRRVVDRVGGGEGGFVDTIGSGACGGSACGLSNLGG